jgi:hypothetical protein
MLEGIAGRHRKQSLPAGRDSGKSRLGQRKRKVPRLALDIIDYKATTD